MPPRLLLDAGHALQVAEVVLRDGPVPADDVVKGRVGDDAQGQAQLGAGGGEQAALLAGRVAGYLAAGC